MNQKFFYNTRKLINYKTLFTTLCVLTFSHSYAESLSTPSDTTLVSESTPQLTAAEIQAFRKFAEKEKLLPYTGVIGTGTVGKTVSSAGGAFELNPSGTNYYAFFSQTLANGFYYEGRLLTRYNYMSQNPTDPSVPISDENNPMGYGVVVKVGYDFHPTDSIQIVPYFRLNAYDNVSVVYADTDGNNINSKTLSYIIGSKLAYKVTPQFNPYIDLSGGYQQVSLTGNITNSSTGQQFAPTANNDQYVFNYEFGFSSKVTEHLSVIPYMVYSTTTNNPDGTAQASYAKGGFNLSPLTGTSLAYGLKLIASW